MRAFAAISVDGLEPILVRRHRPCRDRCRTHDPFAEFATTQTPSWPSELILLGIARPGTAILTQCLPFQCTSFGRSRPRWRKPAELHLMHRGTGFGGSRDRCALRVLACRGLAVGGGRAW